MSESQGMNEFIPAFQFIRRTVTLKPAVALVLGSGLGGLADAIAGRHAIPFKDIPDFPTAKIVGHAGNLVFGTLSNIPVVAMQGRVHFYEGHPMSKVVFGIRLMRLLGAHTLITSNAVGAINKKYKVGDFMIIRDHLNFQGDHPLRGPNPDALGSRFYDMSAAYDPHLRAQAARLGRKLKLRLHEGVYAACMGPSYETPSEIRMLRKLGADAVGMSTVPEVLAARHMGMTCLSISFISNMAAGVTKFALSHEEVMEAGRNAGNGLQRLVIELLKTVDLPDRTHSTPGDPVTPTPSRQGRSSNRRA